MENEKANELILNGERGMTDASHHDLSRKMGELALHEEELHDAVDLEEESKLIDFSNFEKKDFVQILKDISRDDDFKKVDALLREAKPLFDEIREREKQEALKTFIDAGGSADDFEYRPHELDIAFDATYKLIKDRRAQHYRALEEQKASNFQKKIEMLEKLRAIVDADDTEQNFHAFKEIQKEWKNTGPVPNAQVKSLWANYTALIDRFYDHRSIYFELKELDRKKNLEAKLELCVRAEKLLELDKIRDAVRELNELHNEFKHIGPVPKDEKDAVWHRFKTASDAVYAKRDAYLENQSAEQQKNLDEKLKLADEVAVFATFQSDRIKEWNQRTQEILAVQKKWEAIGGVQRTKSKEINKKFWSAFKTFFNNKNQFFKKLDEEREKNLQLKADIVRKAQELKESTDWESTANELKELQKKWKDVGPVPEKAREKIFKEFKEACDFFFEQRRGQFNKIDSEQHQNLEQKEAICVQLETFAESKTGTKEQLTDLIDKFNSYGFVPKKSIYTVKERFQSAVDKALNSLDNLSEEERDSLRLEIQVGNLRNDPQAERKIYQKEQTIRKRISKVENDIAVLRNNLEFFGRSKNAEKYKDEFNDKIKDATEHLHSLKNQLKLLKTV